MTALLLSSIAVVAAFIYKLDDLSWFAHPYQTLAHVVGGIGALSVLAEAMAETALGWHALLLLATVVLLVAANVRPRQEAARRQAEGLRRSAW